MATVARPPVLAVALVSTAAVWWLMGAGAAIVRAQSDPSLNGEWSAVQTWPIVSVHASLLPTGKVIFYPYSDDAGLWDPSTGSIVAAARVGYNIFCSGLTLLADGKLFLAGGHIVNNVGLNDASIYDPQADTWAQQPDMNAGRWYPTTTTLADGSVLVVSGSVDATVGVNRLPQVWTSGAWRDLTTAQIGMPLYPFMLLAPDGRVFNAGPQQTSRYLNTSGTGAWSTGPASTGGHRDWGSAVMYEPGKVLIVGGSDPPRASAEKIDLNLPVPTWQSAGVMHTPRRQLNATILPDGTVLVTGGSSGAGFDNNTTPVYAAERWDPAQNSFTVLASATRYRGYHSIALLLPDGRVLSSGGDGQPNAEVFSPPYLFKGARPVVTSSPSSITYGGSFFVDTPDATSIAAVTLVRLSAVTHAFNMNQRFLRLAFSQAPGGLTVTAPSVAEIAPPGHYMLFVLNAEGVPSIAPIIGLNSGAVPTAPAAPTNLSATAVSSSRINLTWTDDASNESEFRIERSADAASFTEIVVVTSNVTTYADTSLSAATQYWYRVHAYNATGPSAFAGPTSATTLSAPPAAPTNLSATAVSSSRINLTWTDDASNESGFRIERSADAASFTEIDVVTSNVTTYADTSLSAATEYWYRVYAYNATGPSAFAGPTSATTLSAPPAAPTNLSATAVSSSRINLTWTDDASNESGFRIERSADAASFTEIDVVTSNVTTYADTSLSAATEYWYRVYAYNATGPSAFAGPTSATTLSAPPAAPTNLSATAVSSSRINLTWTDDASNESGFRIERSADAASFTEIDVVTSNVTTYADTSLSAATEYWYRVYAYNATGPSAFAGPTSATTLSAPAAQVVTYTETPIGDGLSQYEFTVSNTSLAGQPGAFNVSNLKLLVPGLPKVLLLPPGWDYLQTNDAVQVFSIFAGGPPRSSDIPAGTSQTGYFMLAQSNLNQIPFVVSLVIPAGPGVPITENGIATRVPPAPPTITSLTADPDTLWPPNHKVIPVVTMFAPVGSASAADPAPVTVPGQANPWLAEATTVACGDSAPAQSPVLVPIPLVPGSTLTFSASGLAGYGPTAERSPDGQAFSQIATVAQNVSTYVDTSPGSSKFVFYRVRAFNLAGNSAYSNALKLRNN